VTGAFQSLQVLSAEAQSRISILASQQDSTVPDVFAKSLKRRCGPQALHTSCQLCGPLYKKQQPESQSVACAHRGLQPFPPGRCSASPPCTGIDKCCWQLRKS